MRPCDRVQARRPLDLAPAVLGQPFAVVSARLRERLVTVRRVVHVPFGVDGRRVVLIHHTRVQDVQHESALAEVRSNRDVEVALGHHFLGQVDWLSARRHRKPLARRLRGLGLVEPEQGSSSAVPQEDDSLEPGFLQVPHPRCDIEEQALVDHVCVVVQVPAVLTEDRISSGGQRRDDIMSRELPSRVHQEHDRLWVAPCWTIEDPEALGGVRRLEVHHVAAN